MGDDLCADSSTGPSLPVNSSSPVVTLIRRATLGKSPATWHDRLVNADDEGSRRGAQVVLLCGVAGSGKTTHAQHLEAEGCTRLSIDEEVWTRFGRYGIDYDVGDYERLSEAAEDALRQRLLDLVGQGRDVVVDFSFWSRSSRDRYEQLVRDAGGHWRLLHLQVPHDVLRRRLEERSRRFDANAAFTSDEATLTRYLRDFEAPDGEGEEVLTVAP